jgi:hypothetical protein
MQKDYIMKIIEQFVQAILSIFRLRKAGKYEDAVKEIRTVSRNYLKIDISHLVYYSPDQLMNYFKDDNERALMCAELLYELALVEQAQQNEEESIRLKILSLHLYTAVIPKEEQFQVQKYFDKVDILRKELEEYALPENILAHLHLYNEFKKRQSNGNEGHF